MQEENLHLRVPSELMKLLAIMAAQKFTTKSAIVRELIRLEAERLGL